VQNDRVLALGLMSGTSFDGVDAALVVTDGERATRTGHVLTVPYAVELRERIRGVLVGGDVPAVERVADFRRGDLAAGGQGAPLAPLYHLALARGLDRPLGVLNLGGVANLTWIDESDRLIAFDTGPGNAPIDDWMRRCRGEAFDADGRLARQGRADPARLEAVLRHPFFARKPPKSLDRDAFGDAAAGLSAADGAATLTALVAMAVKAALAHLPAAPRRWLVTGGGRRNGALMAELARALAQPVEPVEVEGWDGDALEAEAFGFLAVRALKGLPLSLPSTTGARYPAPGGALYRAPTRRHAPSA
jgi:anhydro-N-acetylmuramic acid kinase